MDGFGEICRQSRIHASMGMGARLSLNSLALAEVRPVELPAIKWKVGLEDTVSRGRGAGIERYSQDVRLVRRRKSHILCIIVSTKTRRCKSAQAQSIIPVCIVGFAISLEATATPMSARATTADPLQEMVLAQARQDALA